LPDVRADIITFAVYLATPDLWYGYARQPVVG
jgi:hypothetical protein